MIRAVARFLLRLLDILFPPPSEPLPPVAVFPHMTGSFEVVDVDRPR